MNNEKSKQIKNVLVEDWGMSLVEVLVSIAILGVIVTPLASMFISSIRTDHEAEIRLQALTIAQRYMELYKNINSLTATTGESLVGTVDGRFEVYEVVNESSTGIEVRDPRIDGLTDETTLTIRIGNTVEVIDDDGSNVDSEFDLLGQNERDLIISDSLGYEYKDGTGSVNIENTGVTVSDVQIILEQDLNDVFNFTINNQTNNNINVNIYNDDGNIDVSSLNGNITIYGALSSDTSEYDELSVYDITIIVRDTLTQYEVQLETQRMLYK
ncbi:hypothetical protein [Petroclostridium sp. X23]|uniref:type IV pilus modification PilV family protein n=1 Tax=Petroclostridium sp. X23 TaxID=3045146 RepID=UPI0024AD16FF|nr:hypothetical protein [Petroclostridium sp. X23]WHH59658.1 hypothetical protein QKW49_02535 [Petroclostridium sp. X23]